MKIIVDETIYEGTPHEIVENLRGLLLDETLAPDTEGYIRYIQDTYKRVFEQDMMLPDTDLDGRIRAMFAILEDAGLAKVVDVEASTSFLDEMPKTPFSAEVIEYA